MSILLPLILVFLGMLIVCFAYWRDSEFHGVQLSVGFFILSVLGPLSCLAYGIYSWLREGSWGSFSIEDALSFLHGVGLNISFFRSSTSWKGVQSLSEWYLSSNLAWTLWLVPMAISLFWDVLSDRAQAKDK